MNGQRYQGQILFANVCPSAQCCHPERSEGPWFSPALTILRVAETKVPRFARNDTLGAEHSPKLEAARYFAAACAHCDNEVKNAFAPAGGSISPTSEVRNGTMRP
jgi:hypothetical protein